MRRVPWLMIVAVALVALLGALATLQYRWLGDVSQAERERMRAGLQTRASDFSEAFDRELSRTYAAFHVDGEALSADPARAIADAYSRWQSDAAVPALVEAVYLLEAGDQRELTLRRFDPSKIVYASDPGASLNARDADVTTGLFDLRLDELARVNAALPPLRQDGRTARMAITIVRRSTGAGGVAIGGTGQDQGAWLARVRYRSGPLETIVARSRRKNLAIGIGVLGLLAASFVL